MKILFPVYPSATQRSLLEKEPEWRNIVTGVIKEFAAVDLLVLVCVSETAAQTFSGLETIGVRVYIEPEPDALESSRFFPRGTEYAVQRLSEQGELAQDEPLLILDFANPFLSPDLAREARRRWEGEGKPVASIRPPADHPVQLDMAYTLLWADVVVRRDRDYARPYRREKANPAVYSRPFFFPANKATVPVWSEDEVYNYVCPKPGVCCGMFLSESETQWMDTESCETLARYVWSGEQYMRKRTSIEALGLVADRFEGESFYHDPWQADSLLLREEDGRIGYYADVADANKPLAVHWQALDNALTPYGEPRESLAGVENLAAMEPVRLGHRVFRGPLFHPPEDACALMVRVYQYTRGLVSDLLRPLEPVQDLWRARPGQSARELSGGGGLVIGRQDFPGIYSLDKSLFLCQVKDVETVEKLLLSGKVQGLFFTKDETLRISSNVGLCLFQEESGNLSGGR